jgi:hypothetical protein
VSAIKKDGPPFDNRGTPGEEPGPSQTCDRCSSERGANQEKTMSRVKSGMSVCLQLAAILLTAAVAGSALAAVEVPFKGDVKADETYDINYPIMLVNTTGGGTASHLGRFTVTWEFTVNLEDVTGIGSAHFVAANGDSLYTTSTATAEVDVTPGVNRVTETHTVTGGTGRFAGASGTFTLVRLAHVDGTTDGSFEGTIVVARGK